MYATNTGEAFVYAVWISGLRVVTGKAQTFGTKKGDHRSNTMCNHTLDSVGSVTRPSTSPSPKQQQISHYQAHAHANSIATLSDLVVDL